MRAAPRPSAGAFCALTNTGYEIALGLRLVKVEAKPELLPVWQQPLVKFMLSANQPTL